MIRSGPVDATPHLKSSNGRDYNENINFVGLLDVPVVFHPFHGQQSVEPTSYDEAAQRLGQAISLCSTTVGHLKFRPTNDVLISAVTVAATFQQFFRESAAGARILRLPKRDEGYDVFQTRARTERISRRALWSLKWLLWPAMHTDGFPSTRAQLTLMPELDPLVVRDCTARPPV